MVSKISVVVFLLLLGVKSAASFIPLHLPPTPGSSNIQSSTTNLKQSSNNDSDDGGGSSMSEAERMAAVRSLQKSFYSSTGTVNEQDHPQRPELDSRTGILTNLPLWRVGWVEVPGRTNCLNVHEGQYTHMFETILNSGPKPWYVGHLHLPGGFRMTRTGESRFLLKNWRDELQDEDRYQPPQPFGRSAVVGCLMQITDYRRLEDGRLCLLVQTLERFVVDKVIQEFPYSIANVQMLPDEEEIMTQQGGLKDENFCKLARGAAVQQAFQYHPYEFYNIKLPILKNQEYTSAKSINAAAIGKLLSFATYSLEESLLDGIAPKTQSTTSSGLEEENVVGFAGGSPPLEKLLRRGNVLRNPPRLSNEKRKKDVDLDGLETLLWLAVEELVQKTGFVLPSEILALRPPHMDYLDLAPPTMDFVRVEDATPSLSAKYPAYRRQKRLSYSLPAILEDSRVGQGMRQAYLDTPSTKARLEAVLERFEVINSSLEEGRQQ